MLFTHSVCGGEVFMNKVIFGLSLPVVAVVSIAATLPVSAATANHNVGSIVKVSDSCSSLADVASHNVGSIVKIDGGGQCDINEILKSPAISHNVGSIIKITNVCGDTSGLANKNVGSIIKIESNGSCKKDTPTTVIVTEKDSNDTKTEETTSESPAEESALPAELPRTGLGLQSAGMVLVVGGATYLAAYLVSRLRA